MVLDREGVSPNTDPASTGSPPGTSLEDSAMVLTPTVDGSGMPLPSQRGHGNHPQQQSTNDTDTASHIRKRYRDQELSKEATALMLKSWREKSYGSLFSRWYSWCNRREAGPFSAPITNIINFLATLHQQGYQYNSYRSAISSVHEKIDGYSIGQHPAVMRLFFMTGHPCQDIPPHHGVWSWY